MYYVPDLYMCIMSEALHVSYSIQGVLNSSIVMITEIFTPESRTNPVSGIAIVWGVAVALVAPISYILPNWRHYQLLTSLAYLAMMGSWWYVT